MKTNTIISTVALLAIGLYGYSQDPIILKVTQPSPLQADAGNDVQINKGETATLGGNPSASQGYGSYVYSWSPTTGLDDPTLANPTATTEVTTTYQVTVTDAQNCSATDEVTISVDASGIEIDPSGLKIRCYPNPVREEILVEIKGMPSEVTIRLVNTLGNELVYRNTRITGNVLTERIQMQNLPDGMYILQFLTPHANQIQRIIKIR